MRVLASRLALRRAAPSVRPALGLRHTSTATSTSSSKPESLADALDSVLTADLGHGLSKRHSHAKRKPKPPPVTLAANPLANTFSLSAAEARALGQDEVLHHERAKDRVRERGGRLLLETEDEFVAVEPGALAYWGPMAEADAAFETKPEQKKGLTRISTARLRDACPCPKCIHPSTRQKTHTSGEAFREVRGYDIADKARAAEQDGVKGIEVTWPELEGEHKAFYPTSLLRRLASPLPRGGAYHRSGLRRKLWDAGVLQSSAPNLWTDYADLHAGAPGEALQPRPEVFLRILEQLQVFGLAVIRGIPTQKTDNKTNSIREFAEAIGPLRNTFYGETWNVQSMANSKNVAYTSLNLGLHMDLW